MSKVDPLEPHEKPIDLTPPTQIELDSTDRMEQFLRKQGAYEPPEAIEHRKRVLAEIQGIANDYIREEYANSQLYEPEKLKLVNCKILPFGSMRLGVTSAASDIDSLCIAPNFVTRDGFFDNMHKRFSKHPKAHDIVVRRDAFVPIITLLFDQVDIDISFARLDMEIIPDDINLLDDTILETVDETSANSLNGVRVNEMMLKLVPNLDSFRTVLRFLRVWAKARALYGNRYGYLGSVNMALLSAWAVQRYPNATPSVLLLHLFEDLSNWKWPEPIYINTPSTGERRSWGELQNDREQVFPVITPAYPCINSMRSATTSTFTRLMLEFKRGAKLAKKVITKGLSYDKIAKFTDFFQKYKIYLRLMVLAQKQDDFNNYSGLVDSKLNRFLCKNLEKVEGVKGVFLYPNMFETHGTVRGYPLSGEFFIAVQYKLEKGKTLCINQTIQTFITEMLNKRNNKPLSFSIQPLKKNEIPDFCFPKGIRLSDIKKPKHHEKKKPTASETPAPAE